MNRIKLLALGAALAVPAIGAMSAGAAGSNLILNGTFDSSVAGWDNFGGNPTLYKSTMQITNDYTGTGNSYMSGWTCVSVKAGKEYTVEADYWVPEAAPKNSGASLGLHYYQSADCSGANMVTGGGYQGGGKTDLQRGKWQHFSFESTAPAGAKSVRVRATALKEPQGGGSIAAEHTVYFDNVSMRAEQIIIVLPTATPTQPKGPDDISADPTPTQPPKGPDDIAPNPDPTQPPSGDDAVSDPATDSTPDSGDQDNGASVPGGDSSGTGGTAQDNGNSGNGESPALPSTAAKDGGDDADAQLGLAMFGAGGGLTALVLGIGALLRRRRKA